jgi:RNA polymerase sigma-70 factor (ECF subfamily)
MDDRDIVALFVQKDEKGIKAAASKYGGALRQLARSLTGDRHIAEECENDTYLAAWNRIPPDDPSEHLFAYLARIVRYRAIDRFRRQKGRADKENVEGLTKELDECIPSGDSVESTVLSGELTCAINAFLEKEDSVSRDVFVRRYFFFDSIGRICARYDFTQSKVKSILFRMRKRLRAELEKGGYTIL